MTENATTQTETEALRLYRQYVAADDSLNHMADDDQRSAAISEAQRLGLAVLAAPITCPADLAAMVMVAGEGGFAAPKLVAALDARLRDLLPGQPISEDYRETMRHTHADAA